MSWKRWAFGHWGKKERGGWSFVHANCKRNILIGWEHLYVNQMSWLSLKGKIDWKIEREKQYFHIIKNFQYFVMPYTSNSLPHYWAEKAKRWSHLVPALFCAGTILKQNGNPQDPVSSLPEKTRVFLFYILLKISDKITISSAHFAGQQLFCEVSLKTLRGKLARSQPKLIPCTCPILDPCVWVVRLNWSELWSENKFDTKWVGREYLKWL